MIDYNYATDGIYSITDREKFQVLKEVYPDRYISRNICAKYIGAGKEIFSPKGKRETRFKEPKSFLPKVIELLKQEEKISEQVYKEIILSMGFLLEDTIDDSMRAIVRDMQLRDKFKDKPKKFRKYILEQSKELAYKKLNAFFVDMDIELNKKIESQVKEYIAEIVKKVFYKGTQTVNTWEKQRGNIPNSTIKKDLANMFDMQYIIWTKSYVDIQSFRRDLNILKKPILNDKKDNKEELDRKILGEILPISLNEETEFEFISQTTPIKIPTNLQNFSANFMFNLAKLLKKHNQVRDALYVLEILEKSLEPFIFYYKNEIQHLKAILLSSKKIRDWDRAIVELRYLYVDGYHFQEPEILTLLASNYKRKALYNSNGTLKSKGEVNISLLQTAHQLYEEAYALSKDDKYYHAINIAYIILIIDAIEQNNEKKKRQREIATLYNELLKSGFPSDKQNWWQITTQIEFLLLMKRDSEAFDVFESYNSTPEAFEVETTIRQLELYTHFTRDRVGRDFIAVLSDVFTKK